MASRSKKIRLMKEVCERALMNIIFEPNEDIFLIKVLMISQHSPAIDIPAHQFRNQYDLVHYDSAELH